MSTAFRDLDPAELTLGKPVTAMTDSELVSYLRLAVLYYRDIDLPVDGNPERAVMAGLKRTYGSEAGNIVKWACWKHGARDNRGEITGYFAFQKARKWWTDKLYAELQQHRKAEIVRDTERQQSAVGGFAQLKDL